MLGQVRTYDRSKRYGFISGDDGKEYFVHESEIKIPSKALAKGYTVEFSVSDGFPKQRALNVKLI